MYYRTNGLRVLSEQLVVLSNVQFGLQSNVQHLTRTFVIERLMFYSNVRQAHKFLEV
jgi:hypothetical protein